VQYLIFTQEAIQKINLKFRLGAKVGQTLPIASESLFAIGGSLETNSVKHCL
jgi:hypothetical protein